MNAQNRSIPEISVDSMTLYRRLVELPEAEVIPYDDLTALIRRDVRGEAYGNLQTAIRRCRANDQIIIKCVRGVGMRRVPNDEITAVSAERLTKARRHTRTGLRELACTDYDKLTPEQRLKHDSQAIIMGTLHAMSKPSKIKQIETKISESNVKPTTSQTLEFFSQTQHNTARHGTAQHDTTQHDTK